MGFHQPVFIPVVRYIGGMTRSSLYHITFEEKYCGTFYYYEPNSDIYLVANNVLLTPNKIVAYYYLSGNLDETVSIFETNDEYRLLKSAAKLVINSDIDIYVTPEQILPLLPPILAEFYISIHADVAMMVSPGLWFSKFKHFIDYSPYKYENVLEIYNKGLRIIVNYVLPKIIQSMANGTYDFLIYIDDLYAIEDVFDQPLCSLARSLGIDVIVLTTMTGGNRVVSEVLDVRDRIQSYSSLVRLS